MIVLASGSPRRAQLLQQIGIMFVQQVADIDESQKPGEKAEQLVLRLAKEKALKVAMQRQDHLPVLGSDTIGLLQDDVLVKPRDVAHFTELMHKMSGQVHTVLTAVAVACWDKQTQRCEVRNVLVTSAVTFKTLSDIEIADYWQSGEPMDKAGGYAIQGLGGKFVKHISGSYSAIVGLPLYETTQLLESVNNIKHEQTSL